METRISDITLVMLMDSFVASLSAIGLFKTSHADRGTSKKLFRHLRNKFTKMLWPGPCVRCSSCGETFYDGSYESINDGAEYQFKYCPNCGAKFEVW